MRVTTSAFIRRPTLRAALRLIGSSRHSALPALRRQTVTVVPSVTRRFVSLMLGSILIGIAVALLVEANLGLAPYDVLASGLAGHLGLTLGQAGWSVAAVLFAAAWAMGRKVSLWSALYVFANGAAIDAASGILRSPESTTLRVAFVAAAVVVMASGISLVIQSASTGGPFELIMLAVEDRGGSRVAARYVLDIGVLLVGLLAGGSFGIATVFYAASMGATLTVINQALVDHRAGRAARLAATEAGSAAIEAESVDASGAMALAAGS